MKNFIVIRIANKSDDTAAIPVSAFENEADAWKEFYRLCGTAVDSVHPLDAVVILTKDGFELDHKAFAHAPVPAPEPEPEPEPEIEPEGE